MVSKLQSIHLVPQEEHLPHVQRISSLAIKQQKMQVDKQSMPSNPAFYTKNRLAKLCFKFILYNFYICKHCLVWFLNWKLQCENSVNKKKQEHDKKTNRLVIKSNTLCSTWMGNWAGLDTIFYVRQRQYICDMDDGRDKSVANTCNCCSFPYLLNL